MSEPMNELEEYGNKIHEEVTATLSRVDPEQMQSFLDLIQNARKISLYAGGREGLMMRALAMRLFHLGYDVSVVGDMTAPFLTNGDLLILSVGPGYISTVDALRSVAQRDGATVLCLTAQPDGKTAGAADKIVYLPAQTMADDTGARATSTLPMGSLYELVLFVFSEIVVLELLKRTGKGFGQARDRHTNLE
ncbi:MAG TPA: SIS domain-containing protein [Chthoniobacterales bacterium]|nr:SIS domain-containing protein [Chthoniobacterales bacterium]